VAVSLAFDVAAAFDARNGDSFGVAAGLRVESGETLVLLGPSGSGKTLLLETLAGFHDHEGWVELGDEDLTDAPPEDRCLGFVFQDHALFTHRSVRENVAFGARYHDNPRDPDDLLESLGIGDLADRDPTTLSGGEQQRVALARALAIRPQAFLLDEPLSALDAPTRARLRADLADVLADETAVYVTHDRTTARVLADRVAVVRDGEIEQIDTTKAVFERPASPFVAAFTGATVLRQTDIGGAVELPAAVCSVRPEHVALGGPDPDAEGVVERVVREDAAFRVTVRVGDQQIDAFAADPPSGDRVGVAFDAVTPHPPEST
jgi:ABC-type Fe3+/spermidine/putrescine transport system ATPase subunit